MLNNILDVSSVVYYYLWLRMYIYYYLQNVLKFKLLHLPLIYLIFILISLYQHQWRNLIMLLVGEGVYKWFKNYLL